MGTQVADLYATMRMDTSRFTSGARQVSQQADGLAKRFGGLGTALKTAFGAVAAKQVLDVGVAMFKLGVQAQAWERRFTTVFGEAADSVRAWSQEVNEKFGMSDERLRGVASSLGDLLIPMGFTRQAAADMSVEMMNVANALSQWVGGARSAEEAAHIMARGILGERESLKELGVSILETDVQARMLAQGMGNLTGQAREQAKAQTTWQLIQEKSADAIAAYEGGMSDAALAAASMATAIDEMKVVAGDLVIKLSPAVVVLARLVGLAFDLATLNFGGTRSFVEEYLMAPMPTPGNAFSVRGAMGGWQQQIAAQERAAAELRHLRAMINKQRVLRGLHGGDPILPMGPGASQMWGGQNPYVMFGPRGQWGSAVVQGVESTFALARKAAIEQVKGMSAQIGNIFEGIPDEIPKIELSEAVQNALDIYSMESDISAMLAAAGEGGLTAFIEGLSRMTPEQMAAIAGMGYKAWAILNSAMQGGMHGSYESDLGTFVPPGGSSGGGSASGGGGAPVTVNVGTVIGDDQAVATSVGTALRRAAHRGQNWIS